MSIMKLGCFCLILATTAVVPGCGKPENVVTKGAKPPHPDGEEGYAADLANANAEAKKKEQAYYKSLKE